nr:hypothetical protein [Opitutales bacterium]
MRNRVGVLLLLIAQSVCAEDPSNTEIAAPEEDASQKLTQMSATGGAKLQVRGVTVEADHFSMHDGSIFAEGDVRCVGDNFYILCDSVSWSMDAKEIHAKNGQVQIEFLGCTAEELKIDDEEVALRGADVYAQLGPGSPHLSSQSVRYYRKRNRIAIRGGKLRIGRIPVLVFPKVNTDPRFWTAIEVYANAGRTKSKGVYLQSEVKFHVLPDLYAGYIADYYSRRGYLLGPVLKLRSDRPQIKGYFDFRAATVRDHGKDRGVDVDGVPIEKRRGFLDVRGNYHFGEHTDLISDFVWTGDSRMSGDFRHNLYGDCRVRDLFLEYDIRGQQTLITAFMRPKINHFQRFPEELPSLRLNYFQRELGDSGIYASGLFDIARVKGRDQDSREAIESNRFDGYVGLRYPAEFEGVHVMPTVGTRWTDYSGHRSRALVELGLDLNTEFTGFYRKGIAGLGILSWKHIIRPTIQYRYCHSLGAQRFIPHVMTQKEIFFPSLDLAERRDVDALTGQHIIRLGLEQDFWGRKKNKVTKLASFNFYQDFNLQRFRQRDDSRPDTIGDCYLVTELALRHWLRGQFYLRGNWKRSLIEEFGIHDEIASGDLWSLGTFGRFRRHKYHEIGAEFNFQLNVLSSCGVRTKFDAQHGRFLSAELFYNLLYGGFWD